MESKKKLLKTAYMSRYNELPAQLVMEYVNIMSSANPFYKLAKVLTVSVRTCDFLSTVWENGQL